MISDEERREVATRMRNQLTYMRENGEYYKNDRDIVECGNSAYRNIADSVEKYSNLPNGEYQKHFIYLNDWTMYTVEQIDSTKTDKYNYEFNFLPQELPGVKITSKD